MRAFFGSPITKFALALGAGALFLFALGGLLSGVRALHSEGKAHGMLAQELAHAREVLKIRAEADARVEAARLEEMTATQKANAAMAAVRSELKAARRRIEVQNADFARCRALPFPDDYRRILRPPAAAGDGGGSDT